MPIIAVILMLFSARAKVNGSAFAIGWVIGIAAVTAVALLIGHAFDASSSSSASDTVSWMKLMLGVLLLLAAVRQLRSRPTGDEEPAMPKWMPGIDAFTTGKAFGLGALLSSINPKNLALGLSAGASIAQAGISTGQQWGTALIFVALSSMTIPIRRLLPARGRKRGTDARLLERAAAAEQRDRHGSPIRRLRLRADGPTDPNPVSMTSAIN